jgi:hypothetical protein
LRGAIVRHERFVGVVLGSTIDGVAVVPVVNPDQRGGRRHRSDVAHDEAFLPNDCVIRAGDPKLIRSTLIMSGRVSERTLASIELAMRREATARKFEDRHHAGPHHERCVRL